MTTDEDNPGGPVTPRRGASPDKKRTPNATPTHARKVSAPAAGVTPKSAPAAVQARPRSATRPAQPTLLSDFLLGRPSAARIAADKEAARQRRMSVEQVKLEMRQGYVRKVQPPGGVHDRVKQWQKKNATAMASADPLAAPSEPSEVAIQVDDESVTEQDRVRIKLRQKKKAPPRVVVEHHDAGGNDPEKENQQDPRSGNPPKKRVVSDTNWMKNRRSSPTRNHSSKVKLNLGTGSPLPKDFLRRTSPNPPVKNKIKDWAARVEIPDEPRTTRYSASKSVGSGDGSRITPTQSSGTTRDDASDDGSIVVEHRKSDKPKVAEDDGIRVRPIRQKSRTRKYSPTRKISPIRRTSPPQKVFPSRKVSTRKVSPTPKKTAMNDGIRIRPHNTTLPDDGIRVRPQRSTLPDDGIRVYPDDGSQPTSGGASTVRASSRPRSRGRTAQTTSTRRSESPSERTEVIEDSESDEPDTPTRRSSGKTSSNLRQKAAAKSLADTGTTLTSTILTEDVSDSESWSSGSHASDLQSFMPSSLPSKLADIPVGYSAFSELDLPLGAIRKVLTEGKKIVSEKVDPPPKPVANQPRSIESWLNKTVDPFVEESSPNMTPEPTRKSIDKDPPLPPEPKRKSPLPSQPKRRSIEKELLLPPEPKKSPLTPEPQRRNTEKRPVNEGKARSAPSVSKSKSADDVRPAETPTAKERVKHKNEETAKMKDEEPDECPKDDPTTPTAAGLKRSRATRSTSSPLKPGAKKGFKDKLMDAFRGESNAPKTLPMTYPSCSEEVELDDGDSEDTRDRRRSSGSRSPLSSYADDSSVSQETTTPSSYPRRKPPTKGVHELSTIVSRESLSTRESDLSSMLSSTTMTQTTATTRSTGSNLSRHRSNKPGLKRRLTKHSDLVSVLSLPDANTKAGRSSSLRSAHSVRRRNSTRPNTATVAGLLQEFAGDENLYARELKTLVDGVIPVLLTQVINGDETLSKEDLFTPMGKQREDSLAKSVVNMGIVLEKLRNVHRRCPLLDAHRLPQWLDSVHPIYDQYLDVWRLGFQDLIVNLAPLSLDDNDSLINALPRNEEGDVINEDGERIDVAHLLKRPLIRAKWITRFIRSYRKVTGTENYEKIASKWDGLQEKARRRHKEECARIVDEDAMNTDTSRVRDLQTFAALDNVKIDRFRQVYAKDSFSLSLRHSNGQRLECQVELVSRDNQLFKSDPGDLLIRETGSRGRSWLLFAPIPGGQYSARKGGKRELVVMIRGKNDEWFELLTLTTDSEEQLVDWLDILGSSPVPPAVTTALRTTGAQPLVLQPRPGSADIPLGERKHHRHESATQSPTRVESSPELKTKTTPTRYQSRQTSAPITPISSPERPSTPPSAKTPTQESYLESQHRLPESPSPYTEEDRSRPLRESMRPDPSALQRSPSTESYREDGAPPPPAHRITPKKSSTLSPPVDLNTPKIKRRGSSPLKHEYHPSDISSESSLSISCTDTEDEDEGEDEDEYDDYTSSESSDDELEAADMPETMPAISIKKSNEPVPNETPADSLVSESAVSLTPSASASQAGLPKFAAEPPAYVTRAAASISYWDNKKGCWKDLWPEICSLVITPGLIEAYPARRMQGASQSDEDRPLIALDLTPLVMLRNSTVLDLEIRSPVLSYAKLYSKVTKIETTFFRFRAASFQECESLYLAVHRARMDNAKYKALEEEARVRAFGQNQTVEQDGDGSSQRRSWFGRKNSYRVSARAPSQSAGSTSHSSGISASSFLKRLVGGGNQSFDIAMSSVDKQSRGSSIEPSIYTSSNSSGTPPRSPSVSAANSGNMAKMSLTTNNLKIRLHLMVSSSKWEDHGNCLLEVSRPDQGTRQNLRKYQGMEKRVVVTSIPKKNAGKALIILDVILGSRCFSRLGSRGILLNVWEEVKDEAGEEGLAPRTGGVAGAVNKWCFQCASVMEANWIYGLVTQEVMIG
ncbi:uncharacterized protein BCR38DRAFT_480389 [Pseudomassariella vexata]|uniref:Uncharacterized protein n=1 Tax=Pseudomassariella vexata TaxID=1141098 RepID=A0A1Y2EKS8_9PEZI|nr:uncharacterized protein BCR38DRAFT_480389 [Pseudomassariella vexata]ORY71914.1 hypothetical protein BCR38DRAFT_480389 [Pseudomassariella vexata]